jgi:UDP-N-acetylmuramoyl-tripeptide--D-alanyl-D-alanine ligase
MQFTLTGWSIDSRTTVPGDVYFALRGDVHDGHDFVQAAFDKGATAAVVEHQVPGTGLQIPVPSTLAALQKLATQARVAWAGKVIGVTGSAGKTSTKDAIAALLSSEIPTGKTEGNFNNHIGLPLSILRLPPAAKAAVLEMGMNHAGEIRDLAAIAKPDIGVVTNVGYAHLEFFDSIDSIALAKRELIDALPPDGTAVLNADDPRVAAFTHPGPTVTYGFSDQAQVRAEPLSDSRFRCLGVEFETQLSGRHAISNILAGIAVASRVFGIPPAHLTDAVRAIAPGKMRGERIALDNGITILNDCYNSNPTAARSMIDVLAGTPGRRKIAVLGEMLELGHGTESLHRDLGQHVADSGIDVLIALRGAARFMVEQARKAGMSDDAAYFFDDPAEAGQSLRHIAREGDVILFKGSRGVHVERALEAFRAQ